MDTHLSIEEPENKFTLNEQLKSHFKLRADPFSEKNTVFYEGAQRKHNLETLRHLSIFGDMVLLLTGEAGSGKTSLIKRFVFSQDDELNIILAPSSKAIPRSRVRQNSGSEKSSVNRLAASVNLQRVSGESADQTLNRLVQHFEHEYQATGRRTLLVVDDADQLPKEELQVYFTVFGNLCLESGVVLLLAGTPEVLDFELMDKCVDRREWFHQIHLKPLSGDETVEYLQQLLQSVGYQGALSLSELQIENLSKIAKGLPGRINRFFAYVIFELGLPGAKKTESSLAVRNVLFLLTGLLLFSFLVVSYQHGLFDPANSGAESERPESSSQPSKIDLAASLERQRAARLKMLDQAIEASTHQTSETETIFVDEDLAKASLVEKAKVEEAGNIQKSLVNTPEKTARLKEQKTPNEQSFHEEDEVKTTKSVPTVSVGATGDRSSLGDSAFRARSWVQSRPENYYSAQLLGSYNMDTVAKFIANAGEIDPPLYYLKTTHKGRDWFVVFYGEFSSKKAAQAAVDKAPKVIARQGPWLRSFGGILKSYPVEN